MTTSENKEIGEPPSSRGNTKKQKDDDSDTQRKLSLRVDTSNDANVTIQPQSAQNTGSQRMPVGHNNSSTTETWFEHDRQRPEDLRRAQYLTSNYNIKNKEGKDEDEDVTKSKTNGVENRPTCWTTTSWVLTWWAPPFMLKTFGKN